MLYRGILGAVAAMADVPLIILAGKLRARGLTSGIGLIRYNRVTVIISRKLHWIEQPYDARRVPFTAVSRNVSESLPFLRKGDYDV